MNGVVSPVLHKSEPVKSDAVTIELSQLFTTSTVGAPGIIFGVAVVLAGALGHPLTVWVTVYVPAFATVIDGLVSPVLHNNVPVKSSAVNID